MTTTGQWFWYAGVTALLLDIAGTIRVDATPEPWFVLVGVGLLSTGLSIMAIQGMWDTWEQFEAEDGGEPV